jgi:hypothetical protein
MEQQPDAVAYGLDAVRNPLQLFEKFPILENVASATPMATAVWRHKTLQALQATLIAQFRVRHGDRLVNEHILTNFRGAQWLFDIEPEQLEAVLNDTADALLSKILRVFVQTRDRMTVRRGLTVLEVPHTDIVSVVLSMRVCLLQVRLIDPKYKARVEEVLDTVERALGVDSDRELFLRTTRFDFVPSGEVSVEEYFRQLCHRLGEVRGLDVRQSERRFLDLDNLVFADFSLSGKALSLPPTVPYVPPPPRSVPALHPPPSFPVGGMDIDVLAQQLAPLMIGYMKEKGGRGAPPGACWLCGQLGHQKRDCPNRDKQKGGDGKKDNTKN